MVTSSSSSLIVIAVLVAYFAFSIWNAYSTGCNKALQKKHGVKGAINYGSHLGLSMSFVGSSISLFLFYEIIGYYSGFIKTNFPADLGNLDFFTFLVRQFSAIDFSHVTYVWFLIIGIGIATLSSIFLVRFAYRLGLAKIEGNTTSTTPTKDQGLDSDE